ncbi:hypothetical protein EVAR_36186_1 [Eumeta japonica]|uniref:Uncharacterized protein n=1 Tax=Eumeta variegata TaxID=151549 RepID=A0A4C1VSB2_EUMVA|nr:hypothetical protein EVAR_36186_1 [Eumeta japonica]
MIDLRPPQPSTRKFDYSFAIAATGDCTWHRRNKIDAELTQEGGARPQPPTSHQEKARGQRRKKGFHAPLVTHTLASAVMTCFEDWVDKNERYLLVCNLALILMPEKQWKILVRVANAPARPLGTRRPRPRTAAAAGCGRRDIISAPTQMR